MYLPRMGAAAASRDMVAQFRGYNHNDVVSPDQFYDMKNMSADLFPCVTTRKRRGLVRAFEKPNGICSKGCLYWCDGTGFYGEDGEDGAVVLRGSVEDSPKQFASMGALLLIWPDKKYYNTVTHMFGDLENERTAAAEDLVSYTLAKWNPETGVSEAFSEDITVSAAAPADPEDGQYWHDTSSTPNVLKRWSETSGAWVPTPTTYVRISAPGIGGGFSRYDGVKISGSTNEYFNNTFIAWDVGENYITVTGLISASFTQPGGLTVKRETPDMDFIAELDNRLWGCSSEKHEIYSCKLGDPFNWNAFEGISADSYAATVGSDGAFTGAIAYMGYILFFKENIVHKVYGSKPANYQLTETALPGVEKGSEKSLVIVGTTLYYKSRAGVMAYQGGFPENISDALGAARYSAAAAGSDGRRLYISMREETNPDAWHLFVIDEARGIWSREDDTHAAAFAAVDGKLYFLAADKKLYATEGGTEAALDWYLETGDYGDASPDNKYLSKLQLKFEMSETTKLYISVQYDSSGLWEPLGGPVTAPRKRIFAFPIIPRRCHHMRVRISGIGDFKLFSVTKTTEQGSEL